MGNDFKRKVVVITGATGGIGRALTMRFARARAKLVLLDLDEMLLSALANKVEALGVEVMYRVCDVTDEERCRKVMQEVVSQFGGIDVLINNAGISHRSQFTDTHSSVFRKVMDVNFFGSLHCTQAALPSLLHRQGQIITMSSLAGFKPQFGRSGYAASKHALHGLFESLRYELKNKGVRVMMVCPGFTATDINKNALQGDGSISSIPFSPLGQVASPINVAEAIFNAAVRGKDLLVLSNVNWVSRVVATLFPNYYQREMSRRLQIKPEEQREHA